MDKEKLMARINEMVTAYKKAGHDCLRDELRDEEIELGKFDK